MTRTVRRMNPRNGRRDEPAAGTGRHWVNTWLWLTRPGCISSSLSLTQTWNQTFPPAAVSYQSTLLTRHKERVDSRDSPTQISAPWPNLGAVEVAGLVRGMTGLMFLHWFLCFVPDTRTERTGLSLANWTLHDVIWIAPFSCNVFMIRLNGNTDTHCQ